MIFRNSKTLINFIIKNWHDVWLSLAILIELNALPLFIQITQIVGGVLVSFNLSICITNNEM